MTQAYDRPPGSVGCIGPAFDRNRYFTGKYMTARDFALDPDYALGRHRLHNRMLHGWGVVAGLEVCPHPDPKQCARWVVVKPGLALDCCGRELIVCDPRPVAIPAGCDPNHGDGESAPVYVLYARYDEEPIEPQPVLYAEGPDDARRVEHNRVREVVRLEWVPADRLDKRCWPTDGGRCGDGGAGVGTAYEVGATAALGPQPGAERHPTAPRPPSPDLCRQPVRGGCDEPPGCLPPDCPCGDWVPLARVQWRANDGHDDMPHPHIDMHGRPAIGLESAVAPAAGPPPLTRVVGISWPHGGTASLGQVAGPWGRRLVVTFDRPLRTPPAGAHGAWGVNMFTFEVFALGSSGQKEIVAADEHEPPVVDPNDPRRAVFTIDADACSGRLNLGNSFVYVVLKCDFILDCDGRPVDGNHLGGRLPSGDGVPGGTFESWFYVDAGVDSAHGSSAS